MRCHERFWWTRAGYTTTSASPVWWWPTAAFASASPVPAWPPISRATSPGRRTSTWTPTWPGSRVSAGATRCPSAGRFQAAARRAGISAGSTVVAYDEAGEGGAARLWWLLRHHGHDAVAVLDGGLAAWRDGRAPAAVRARAARRRAISPLAHARGRHGGRRAGPRRPPCCWTRVRPSASAARRSRVDPVAGHIPGAVNLPFAELAPGGRFLEAPALRRRLESAGVSTRRRGGRLLRLGRDGVHPRARRGGGRDGARCASIPAPGASGAGPAVRPSAEDTADRRAILGLLTREVPPGGHRRWAS